MPQAYLDISADLIVSICKSLARDDAQYFKVISGRLPDDAKLVRCESQPYDVVRVVLESPSFTEGERLNPTLQAIRLTMQP